MKRFVRGPFDFRILNSPRFYLRFGRVVVLWWPYESLLKRLEVRVDAAFSGRPPSEEKQ